MSTVWARNFDISGALNGHILDRPFANVGVRAPLSESLVHCSLAVIHSLVDNSAQTLMDLSFLALTDSSNNIVHDPKEQRWRRGLHQRSELWSNHEPSTEDDDIAASC